jgi:predicted nucleic acid-binding Zn finger protein
MSKNAYRTPTGFKEIECSCCKKQLVKVDSNSVSATCFRCVSRASNSESVFVTDLSPEDYKEFIKKVSSYGRSENNTTKSPV